MRLVQTRLVCLENTHTYGGGRVYPLEKITAISTWARRHANVANVTRFWEAMVGIWVVGFATLYLGPQLT